METMRYIVGSGTLIRGNALTELRKIKSKSVNSIITSPPYWPARKYTEDTKTIWGGSSLCKHTWKPLGIMCQSRPSNKSTTIGKMPEAQGYTDVSYTCKKCGAMKAQLGLEPSLTSFMIHMKWIINQLIRVLRDDGIMYINWGDTYYNKNLTLQNYRVIQHFILGGKVILRDIIIWEKLNHMPETVQDRMVRAYEPIFMLTKKEKYYHNTKALKVPAKYINDRKKDKDKLYKVRDNILRFNTAHSKQNHFAAFPEDMIKVLTLFSVPKDGIVLDPFHGTGTVGAVAEKNNRRWIGIELSMDSIVESHKRIQKIIDEKSIFLFP